MVEEHSRWQDCLVQGNLLGNFLELVVNSMRSSTYLLLSSPHPIIRPCTPLDTKKANFSVKMSTAASPKLEDEQVVAATDVMRGTTDQAHFVDVKSEVNRETVGAAEDVVDSNDDKDVEKGCVTYVDDPPDGLDRDGKMLEEKIEGSHASLEVVGDTERTDNERGCAVGAERRTDT